MRAMCSRSTHTTDWRTAIVSKSQRGRELYRGSLAALVRAATRATARIMAAGWRLCSRLCVALAPAVAQILCSAALRW